MPYTPITEWRGKLFERQLIRALNELDGNMSISAAEREVLSTYGDTVSVSEKAKSLLKFGRNNDVDTGTRETVWNQGGDETYVTTNAIDTISSSDAGDTQSVNVEYHTVTGTGTSAQFTFGTQDVTLNGQNKVTLGTPCARISRIRNNDNTAFSGDVYVYEDTAITSGVPNDATKIHAKANAGDDQTFKCATTFSNVDYAFVSKVYASVKRSTSAVADIRLEVRAAGGAFEMIFDPMIIIPKNADVRMTVATNTNNTSVDGGFHCYLAAVQ